MIQLILSSTTKQFKLHFVYKPEFTAGLGKVGLKNVVITC